jgi:tetratricopeptide (TPR) repeat protein
MALTSILLLSVLAASTPSSTAEIEKAKEAFALGDFEGALRMLSHAEMAAAGTKLKAQAIFQQGVILEAMGNETDALIAFARAASLSPNLEANTIDLNATVIHLFRCGRALAQKALDAKQIRAVYKSGQCPVPIAAVATPKPSAKISAAQNIPKVIPPTPPANLGPALSASAPPNPQQAANKMAWLWGFLGSGVAAFAGGVAVDQGLKTGQDGKLEAIDFAGAGLMAAGTTAVLLGLFGNPYDSL